MRRSASAVGRVTRQAGTHLESVFGGAERSRVIVVLAALLALSSADGATVGAAATPLRSALHIDNTDIGLLVTASSVVAALASVPFGVLADRVKRTRTLAFSVVLWGVAMLWSATAPNFGRLLFSRLFLGVVTASAGPLVASLVGDYFPAAERGRVYGYILTGELVGAGIGFAVTGDIAALSWRAAFVILALPAFVLARMLWRLPEPARGTRAPLPHRGESAGSSAPGSALPGPAVAGTSGTVGGRGSPGGPPPGESTSTWDPRRFDPDNYVDGRYVDPDGQPGGVGWDAGRYEAWVAAQEQDGTRTGELPPLRWQDAPSAAEPTTPGTPGADQEPWAQETDAQRVAREKNITPDPDQVLRSDPRRMGLWSASRYVLSIRTNLVLIIASACGYFYLSGVETFGVEFATDQYGVPQAVANLLVLLLGVGAVLGVLVGGSLSDRLLQRRILSSRVLVAAIAAVLTTVFFVPAIFTRSTLTALPYLSLAGFALTAQNPPIDAARLDIMPPLLWGRAEGIRTLLRTLAQSLAPVLFGAMSQALGGGRGGLQWTFAILLVPLAANGVILFVAVRSYPRDVATAAASRPPTVL
jgi:MFS family permease